MIEWYRNGEFVEDDSPEEPEQIIKVGDEIKMKNNINSLYTHVTNRFKNSDFASGVYMGKVLQIKKFDNYDCVLASNSEQWYKMECVEKSYNF